MGFREVESLRRRVLEWACDMCGAKEKETQPDYGDRFPVTWRFMEIRLRADNGSVREPVLIKGHICPDCCKKLPQILEDNVFHKTIKKEKE